MEFKKYRNVVDCKSSDFSYVVRTNNVEKYFREIRKYPVLTTMEERRLLKLVKTGTKEQSEKAKEKLIACNQRFVASVAKKWCNGYNFLDVVNEGNFGLIEAVNRYDLKNECHFITYAVWWIRRYISDYVVSNATVVTKPNRTKVRKYIRMAKKAFMDEYYREPNAEEIIDYVSEHYGLTFRHKEDFYKYNVSSIDYEPDDDGTTNEVTLFEFNSETAENNVEHCNDNDDNKKIINTFLKFLSEKEYFVVTNYYGIGTQPKTIEQICGEMKRSKERVRQLLKESIVKMQSHKDDFKVN